MALAEIRRSSLLPRGLQVEYVNAHALPSDANALREAELVAGGLSSFFQSGERVPRITEQLRLPVWGA